MQMQQQQQQRPLGLAILGTGIIATSMVSLIGHPSSSCTLVAVGSRSLDTATRFVQSLTTNDTVHACGSYEEAMSVAGVDAVYIGVVTASKEALAMSAIRLGKHVLFDKPFLNSASCSRIIDASRNANVICMDCTHFVHHPRTNMVALEDIGQRTTLVATFVTDKRANHIGENPLLEPQGAIGYLVMLRLIVILC
jgi:predicted dehydrogenase